jgi:choline dehydrogenase-like flavoprotein
VDVLVVGAGAAGCVVAARLAESGTRSVTLLEAGADLRASVPDRLRDGWEISREFDWGYASEPDTRGEVENVRRSKLVGGTSWVTRFAIRGSPSDYDDWAARGNPGWGFEDVLPYLNRLEADADFGDRPYHGDSGPMPVRRYLDIELTEACAAGLQALEGLGFPIVDDHNRPDAIGAGRMPMSSNAGVRVTTADAYLSGDVLSNLTIRPDAHVAEVVLDGSRATGVRLVDGELIEADDVVLCAGAIGSPLILMRSGVGPPEHLSAIGIPVRVALPGVGANLADHPALTIDCGPCANGRTAPVLHVAATFHSDSTRASEAPDLMLWISDPVGDPPHFEIEAVLLRPRSRGTVRLRSADPSESPRITLPGLGERTDAERLAEVYRRGLGLARSPELRRLCPEQPSPPGSGADDDALDTVRAELYSLPHLVGTCAMGPDPDDGAVVGAAGGVHGTERLSVADASLIPDAPSGFTHIPTIMIAERLAERIGSP